MFEINFWLLLVQILTFGIAVFFLWKFAWKPFSEFLLQRQEKIRKDLEFASESKIAMQKLEEEYKKKFENLKEETKVLINEAKNEGIKIKEQMALDAQKEAEEIRKKALEHFQEGKHLLVEQLKQEISSLSLDIAEKILKKSIDEKIQKDYFKEISDNLEKFSKKM